MPTLGLLLGLAAVALFALDWKLDAFRDVDSLSAAWQRMLGFLGAFGAPDLSGDALMRVVDLALETVAVALMGVLLGAVLAYPLALCAARCVVMPREPAASGWHRGLRRVLLECARLLLDALRGIPDFAWAVFIANFVGAGPLTGVLAIGISVAGILGKIWSELWDAVPLTKLESVTSTGAGHLQRFFYAVQPLAARGMLSFTLMRTECALRNASVIGLVGGGGLGAALFEELNFGNDRLFVTFLLALVVLVACAELFANVVRSLLRLDGHRTRLEEHDNRLERQSTRRRRIVVAVAFAVLLIGTTASISTELARGVSELQRIEWGFILGDVLALAQVDLAASTLLEALNACVIPLCLGVLATLASAVLAGALAGPASVSFQLHADRFTGENPSGFSKFVRWTTLLGARTLALVARAIPDVAWVLILAAFFKLGLVAGLLGMTIHGFGVLARVFVEAVDDVPPAELQRLGAARRSSVFVYGALPAVRNTWNTYTMFQFEVNVRMGIVLGIIGVGGIGDKFDSSLKYLEFHRAGTFLLFMVLLTVVIDRVSRRLGYRVNASAAYQAAPSERATS